MNLQKIIKRYMTHKNKVKKSPMDDFHIRIRDHAYSFVPDKAPDKADLAIDKEKSKIFEKLTIDFIEFCGNKNNNIDDARKAFNYIRTKPKQWKETVHKMLNAGSHHYHSTEDKDLDDANKAIEHDIFSSSYEDIQGSSKRPIWQGILYSQCEAVVNNLFSPISTLFKKIQNKKENYQPPYKDTTLIGDHHDMYKYVENVLDYIEENMNKPEMCHKKIIVAYENGLLSARLGYNEESFHRKIAALNKKRQENNSPEIELIEIDKEYDDIKDERTKITDTEENTLIKDAVGILDKHRDKLSLSEYQKECVGKFDRIGDPKYGPIDFNPSRQAEIIFDIFSEGGSHNESLLSPKEKLVIHQLQSLITNAASIQMYILYQRRIENIKTLMDENKKDDAKMMMDALINDPLIKKCLHFSRYSEVPRLEKECFGKLDVKRSAKILFDKNESIENKIFTMSNLIDKPSDFISYLRSEFMLGEVREWRTNAKEKMATLDPDSSDYKKSKETADAHIVMFMGQSHVDDLKPIVDGAKILNIEPQDYPDYKAKDEDE